jgi:hypothetical protein
LADVLQSVDPFATPFGGILNGSSVGVAILSSHCRPASDGKIIGECACLFTPACASPPSVAPRLRVAAPMSGASRVIDEFARGGIEPSIMDKEAF